MRKRLALLWTPLVLALALMLPGVATATSYGKIANTSTSCRNGGNRVNATFKLTKYSGFYSSTLTMTVYGQGYYGGVWKNEYSFGTYTDAIYTSSGWVWSKSFFYVDNAAGSSRISVVAKIKNGSHVIATGKAHSGFCG
jgi:hypothetical protein